MRPLLLIATGAALGFAAALIMYHSAGVRPALPKPAKPKPYCAACRNTGWLTSTYVLGGDGGVRRESKRCFYCQPDG